MIFGTPDSNSKDRRTQQHTSRPLQHKMESKTYKELQALAKLHGIRANMSKAFLIDKLASREKLHQDPQASSSHSPDKAEEMAADSDTPEVNPGTPLDEAAHDNDDSSAALPDPVEPGVLVESSERRRSDRLSAAKKEAPALLDTVEPEIPVETSERRKSDILSATAKVRM